MSFYSMQNALDSQNCEGILIFHSLFAEDTNIFFDQMTWKYITSEVERLLSVDISFKLLKERYFSNNIVYLL